MAVDQRQRLDFKVEALNPAGEEIADIHLGGTGPGESIWAGTEVTGNYEIKISAPTTKRSYGPYALQLEKVADLRTAPASDQIYVRFRPKCSHRLRPELTGDRQSERSE